MKIVESAIKHRQITLVLTMILVAAGLYSLQHMPRREDPKMTIRQGLVILVYPGATAQEMEEQVTKKVENLLFTFKEVKKDQTEASTSDGEMVIQVELQDWVTNADEFWSKARHDLYELKKSLPRGVIGPFIRADFGDTVALLIAVASDRHGYRELLDFVEIIEDQLRPLPEAAKLKRYGGQPEQIYVTSDSLRMAQYGISQGQLIEVLQSMNSISYAGEIKTDEAKIPIHVASGYDSVAAIGRQIVHISAQGGVVRIADVAKVERRYAEPESFIRVNGQKVLMLAVEMQEGFNIVDFGAQVDQQLAHASQRIPADVVIKKIIDQPKVVNHDIKHFMIEFAIAILAVVLVTVLLLPLRIAVVAALAIPVTILITFALLDLLAVDLQQMTLAGLIVVLGMVVDNAIVVVDDYVERLDRGSRPWDAALRSASELFVPVFSATLAIICAFIPLNLILTGNAGEFLFTLPIAVTVALVVSLAVAVLIIPLLCYLFIKSGLASSAAKKRFPSLLDLVQRGYDLMLARAFRRPWVPILLGLLALVSTVWLATRLEVRMFPRVERNQFCLEIYMDKGVRLAATDRAVAELEAVLGEDPRVVDLTSFVGTGSPRFYCTYAPQPPDANYAQMLITTTSAEATDRMVAELVPTLRDFLPNGEILVKQLQQGPPVDAPIEVRVVGNDLRAIRRIGEEVVAMLEQTRGTNFVRTTFQQDYLSLSVSPDHELANRLGLSSRDIAQVLAGGFKGVPISTLWEGDHPLAIVLRLDQASRDEPADIANTYLHSPVTGGRVPLRQVAELEPQWQPGRIRRRNGVRTLTVRSEAQLGRLPNQILAAIRPQIANLELPPGVTISYGGELEDQEEVLGQQSASLVTSLVLIFIVLLFQFKDIRRSLLIMAAIPMSWFGGFLGLWITSNPISVTGFLGLISLSGLVVRNGIILLDHADQLLAQEPGRDLREVAAEAARRRMRPVFLTAMAAAMGVVPMIISGSPLWAPLGAVVCVGLIFGLLLTLAILPILYWLVLRPRGRSRSHAQKPQHCAVAQAPATPRT